MNRNVSFLPFVLLVCMLGGCAQSVDRLPILATLSPVTPSASTRAEIQLQVKDERQQPVVEESPPESDWQAPLIPLTINSDELVDSLQLMLENQLSHRGIRVVDQQEKPSLVVTVESITHRSQDDLWLGNTYTRVNLSALATTPEGNYQNSYQIDYSQPFHATSDDEGVHYLVSTAIFKVSQQVLQDAKLIRFITE
ncbi:hypothetical protein SG34_032355 [Thalassomonas viridans]|uniref:Lipoprotein n=1 Tax=Thalassomonas viridans TaxID=137584 RepID=A0AAE9Z9S0_9GAMM|nr:YajG family lipoprotein [Thalassomonas viridans]WDE08614.1 hypothetical protein SG34_032355 [Thalassomonas viridans]